MKNYILLFITRRLSLLLLKELIGIEERNEISKYQDYQTDNAEMGRLVRRSKANSSVREGARSHPTDSANLFIRRKRDKRRVKKRVRTRKLLSVRTII